MRTPRFLAVPGLLTAAILTCCHSTANAAIDTLVTVVPSTLATGGNSLSTFGYDPVTDSMYVTAFGAGAALRKISNVGGTQTSAVYVSETELQLYYRDGNVNRAVSSALQSGLLLNPKTIGSGPTAIAPYQMAIIADSGFTRFPTSSTTDPAATKRFYSYNLQSAEGGDGRDVFTTLATLSNMQTAIGTTSTSTNQGRQFAWSGDGQSLYFADSGNPTTAFGGLWKLNAVTGAVSRLVAEDDINTEPAVISNGGVDTIYVRGGGSTGNLGGVDKFTYDGTTLTARQEVLSVEAFREFLDAGADQEPTSFAMAADEAGNLYFNNSDSSPERRGIFKLDVEGRLAKVVSYAERDIVFTGVLNTSPNPNGNTLRMQPRTVTHPTAGSITQILYAESTPVNSIAGAYVFEVGDFDRNGAAGETADMTAFSAALKTRGTALTNVDHYKFDLNANSVVDWKDVKILQQFVDLPNGDANFDGVLDLVDLDVVGANYYTASPTANKTWTSGDFASVDPLYAANAVDANIVNLVDLQLFADTWLNVLDQPITKTQLTSRGYVGQFLDDVLNVFGFSAGLAGDFDLNGVVDGADFLAWQQQFGTSVTPGTGADADGDGLVDGDDLAIWQGNFGAIAAAPVAAAVPEPSALLLGTLAVAGVAGLRRRQSVR
ncbi:hypothetical protein [Lacipirellula sp.]|uniref:hypothetical protein n=1 Tax=Lacipirellula sp. TaxID=2691419 RepID=UPI003D12817B